MMMNTPNYAAEPFAEHVLTGDGPAIRRLRMQVSRIAPHFRLALIAGEPGTGKLTVAREMHRLSPVAHRTLCILSIEAFVQRFAAESDLGRAGMLVLRGLGTADSHLQEALLRQLQRVPRETRIVFTTRVGLKGLVAAGRLQHGLAQRLGTLEICVPALRHRGEDLEVLAAGMLGAGVPGFAPAAIERLRAHGWRGNLRELWQLCRQFSARDLLIQPEELPSLDEDAVLQLAGLRLEDVMRKHVREVPGPVQRQQA